MASKTLRTAAAFLLGVALAGPALAQPAPAGTQLQAWLGRTARTHANEKQSFYVWGATEFAVDEYRIPSDELDRAVRDGSVSIDTARLPVRRTQRFTGQQGEMSIAATAGVYVYVARVIAGQPNPPQAQAVVVSDIGLAAKRDRSRLIALVHEREAGLTGARLTVLQSPNGANSAPRVLTNTTTGPNGVVSLAAQATGGLILVARRGSDVAIQQVWETGAGQQPSFVVHAQTDRPLYRPGDEVQWRAIVRAPLASSGYRTPIGEEVRAYLRGPDGQRLSLGAARTSDFGTASGRYALGPSAKLGAWALELEVGAVDPNNPGPIGVAGFGVEMYRKPEFKVGVAPARATYVQGEQVSAVVDARYYFGAPVPRGKVHYTVTRRVRWRWWNPWLPPMVMKCMWRPFAPPEVVAQGDATTATDGKATITFATARGDQDADYEVAAQVTDASDRMVAGSATFAVNRAAFDLQVLSDRQVYQPGDTIRLKASAAAADQSPVAGVAVELKVEALDPQGARTLRFTRTVTTGADGTAGLLLAARTKGEYVVTCTARDAAGNTVTSERSLWIHDETSAIDWRWDQVQVVADKEAYEVGETALLLVRAPVTSGRGLLTIESRSIQSAFSFPIRYGMGLVSVRVTADMAPNVFATVLVPTRDGVMAAEKELLVPNTDDVVEVTVTADKAEYRPGEQATFGIKTADRFGRPVSCDVALGVVDEALFALRDDAAPKLVDTFFPRRWDEVATVGAGGGGRPIFMMKSGVAPAPAASAGGKGAVRERFVDTLRFVAGVVTDARGEARVTQTMSDDLTTWRLTARAVTRADEVGETRTTTLVRKDLIVRLALPRTLVEGDEMTLVGVIHNLARPGTAGSEPATVRVRLDVQGATVVGAASQTVRVARGDLTEVSWTVRADRAGLATFEAHADAPFDQDALRLPLQVAARGVPVREVKAGSASADGRITLTVTKDPRSIDAAGELKLVLTPSLAGTLLDSLEYLTGYPYGCVEQTMSRFLPDVIVQETLHTLGKDDPRLAVELPKMVAKGVDMLTGMQGADGGWGWFGQNESHPYVSAYVLHGLALAKAQGFAVPQDVLDRGVAFLEGKLDAAPTDLDGKAYMAWSLATAGRVRTDDLRALARDRARLGDYAKAVTALALAKANDPTLARQVLAELDRTAVRTAGRCHWEGSTISYGNWTSNAVETTAYAARAYLAVDAQSARLPDTMAWLVERRSATGQWVTTKDTAAVVIAFAEHVARTSELDPDLAVNVAINGQGALGTRFAAADVGKPGRTLSIPASALRTGTNTITIDRTGRGVLYYAATLEQAVRLDPILAADHGVSVRRELFTVTTQRDANGQLTEVERPFVGSARLGDRLRVKLAVSVTRGGDVEHVNIEDRFPAGFAVVEDDPATFRGWWRWSSAKEVHDDRVVFFATGLSTTNASGGTTYEYQYDLRAEVAGRFLALPAQAEAVYTPDVNGRSDAKAITIR